MSIGSLLQAARADAANIASSGGFQVTAILSTPNGLTQLTVTGLGTGTWMVVEDLQSGKPVNSRSNSFDIPVDQLKLANYPGFDANGRVDIKGHQIIVQDGAGMAGKWVISEQHPNTTLGLIPCILGAKKN